MSDVDMVQILMKVEGVTHSDWILSRPAGLKPGSLTFNEIMSVGVKDPPKSTVPVPKKNRTTIYL